MIMTTTKAVCSLIALSVLCGVVFAQSDDQSTKPAGTTTTIVDAIAAIGRAEPSRRAGLKASLMRQTQQIIPAVVVVTDSASYLSAIESWEGPVRFPVLFDDGTDRSQEDIARFVRGFGPEKVLVYKTDNHNALSDHLPEREQQIESTLAKALGDRVADWRAGMRALRGNGLFSPGLVVTDPMDDGWAAALALSAGRVQPIVFVDQQLELGARDLTVERADTLEVEIERAAESTGMEWRSIGDDLDAVTLVMNIGTRIKTGDGARDSLATTDRIGRADSNGSGARWAFCGQLIGSTSSTVYQAMCALFLEINSAFLWDGYANTEPWSRYDMTEAENQLAEFGIDAELHDQPGYTLDAWRRRITRPVDAGLILLNSKGSSRRFDLPGGGASSGDVPILERPSVIHMVHSFSMQKPTAGWTIGGRLLERGVYAYAGSVDEPYLNGFVPSPLIARRLGGSIAFASAVRYDDGKPWKIAVLGDPLITIGPAGLRMPMPEMSDGFIDLDARSGERVKSGDFGGAIRDLVLLGRDHDAARLAMALMKDRPLAFTEDAARAAIPALFREGEHGAVVDAYEHLDVDDRESDAVRDVLWASGRAILLRGGDARVEALLRSALRKNSEISDAEELAMFLRRRSLDDAVALLESLRARYLNNNSEQRNLDNAIKRVRGG